VILEGANCTFGLVSSVYVWWHQLKSAIVGGNCAFEGRTHFIIEDVFGRRLVACSQPLVGFVVGCNAVGVAFRLERADKDCIRLRVETNHDVLIAPPGSWCKSSRVIREDATDRDDFDFQ
jgi:hypothetical protein